MQVVTQSELVDIVAAGFDAGVRYGETLAQDVIAVSLGPPQRMTVVATPDYVTCHGLPAHPRELAAHRCIGTISATGNKLPWWFERGPEVLAFAPQAELLINSAENALIAARAAISIAYTFEDYPRRTLPTDGSWRC